MRYLHKTPENQLVDLSMEEPLLLMYSPLERLFQNMEVPFPNCCIGLRVPTASLKPSLPSDEQFNVYKIPGDLDIVGGPLFDETPGDCIVGIEVKRFRYLYSETENSWALKNPDSYGRKQAKGYSLFGFKKIMLCHFVVAEPIQHPNYNPHLLNAVIISDGIDAVRNKKILIESDEPFGYCIIGWSQVPHKDPLDAGLLPGPYIVVLAPELLLFSHRLPL